MRLQKLRYAFVVFFFLFPLTAHAQYYGYFDNPNIRKEMSQTMLYPTGIIQVVKTAGKKKTTYGGSGTIIFSGPLHISQVCEIEKDVLKDSDVCKGDTNSYQVRTYMLTADHLFEHPVEQKKRK